MAIHDQKYLRYEGPLKQRLAWWVIATTSLRLAWGFLRTKLILMLLWVVPIIMLVVIVLEYAFGSQALPGVEVPPPSTASMTTYVHFQVFSVALLFMASGCGIISDDLRFRTLQLYFSKPMAMWEYVLGKFLSLFLLGALISILPTLLLSAVRTTFFWQSPHLNIVIALGAKATLVSAGLLLVMSSMVLGLSSLTRRTGYVVLAWIALLFVPIVIHGIIALATDNSVFASLCSLPGLVSLTTDVAWGELPSQIPWWGPLGILALVAGAGVFALVRRLTKLEGIA